MRASWRKGRFPKIENRKPKVVPPPRQPPMTATLVPGTDTTLVTIAPMHTVSEGNLREPWWEEAARAKHQRTTTYYWLRAVLKTPEGLPWPMTIALTRVGVQLLDAHDGLPGSFKHIVDGIADFLFQCPGQGHKYDNDPRITWCYDQRVHRKKEASTYCIEIRFSPTPEEPCP